MRILFTLFVALLALTSAACSTAKAPEEPTATKPDIPAYEIAAKQAVADKYSIDKAALTVTESKAVEFSDSSLNCPEPGMMYAQVITPGHQVLVTYENKIFDVRVAGDFAQVCEKGGKAPRPRPQVK